MYIITKELSDKFKKLFIQSSFINEIDRNEYHKST